MKNSMGFDYTVSEDELDYAYGEYYVVVDFEFVSFKYYVVITRWPSTDAFTEHSTTATVDFVSETDFGDEEFSASHGFVQRPSIQDLRDSATEIVEALYIS